MATIEHADKFMFGDVEWEQCVYCRHSERGKCAAFPNGVPRDIRGNEFDHRLPHADDNGVRFEPKRADWQPPAWLERAWQKARERQEHAHA